MSKNVISNDIMIRLLNYANKMVSWQKFGVGHVSIRRIDLPWTQCHDTVEDFSLTFSTNKAWLISEHEKSSTQICSFLKPGPGINYITWICMFIVNIINAFK